MERLIEPSDIGLHASLCEIWDTLDNSLQTATALCLLCHHGVDPKLRRDQAKTWWSGFFPDRIVLCSRISSSLSEFASELTVRLQGQIGGTNDAGGERHRIVAASLFGLPEETQSEVLDALERQATVISTIIRASLDGWRQEKSSGKKESSQASFI